MKLSLDVPLKDVTGTSVPDVTICKIAIHLLTIKLPGDELLPADKQIGMVSLAVRIHEGGERDYTCEEIALLRSRAFTCTNQLSSPTAISRLEFMRLCETLPE